MQPREEGSSTDICFGLDRDMDQQSLRMFLQRFVRPALLEALVPRLEGGEITAIVDLLTRLMGRHLSEKEYHRLFLAEERKR